MFNLESAKPLERTFERKGTTSVREQKFEIKHRSSGAKSNFIISNKTWDSLNLADDDLAVAILANEDEQGRATDVAIRIVDADDKTAKIFKKSLKGEKNPTFNSSILEKMLQEAGILEVVAEDEKRNQYISLSEYTEDGVTVYVLSADARDVSEIESYASSEEEVEAGDEVDV